MPDFHDKVNTAKNEALRFLRRIREWENSDNASCVSVAQTGAIKRASMDLTRALADLRKGAQY